ncbi:hypothetical protein [Allosphingosinicella sp.]|uniref:hypothetical protein n=1 Tax=Allosphingosinicella sp. TaxID=2823234 RepID=UPI003D7601DC
MLSLNVASERAELAKVERQIIAAKQEIRSLQTELGTRGRLQQLEHWNAEVLALSAPAATQFVENEMMLARFETHERTVDEKAKVQMASVVTTAPAPAARPTGTGKKLAPADYAAAAERNASQPQPMLRQAAFVSGGEKAATLVKAAAVKAPAAKAEAARAKPTKSVAKAGEPKAPKSAAKAPEPTHSAAGEIATGAGAQ